MSRTIAVSSPVRQAYVPSEMAPQVPLVTSAASFGRLVTDIDLTIDELTGEVTTMAANNVMNHTIGGNLEAQLRWYGVRWYRYGENVGWIRLGSYDGGGSHTYANDAATTYGVSNEDATRWGLP